MDPATRLETARAAVDAARSVGAVHDVDGGAMGAFATMGAGEWVCGVRIDDRNGRAEIRVIARFGAPLPSLADEVREAVTAALAEHGDTGPWTVDVRVTDVVWEQPALEAEV